MKRRNFIARSILGILAAPAAVKAAWGKKAEAVEPKRKVPMNGGVYYNRPKRTMINRSDHLSEWTDGRGGSAVWNKALTENEIQMLVDGVPINMIRPGNIVKYTPTPPHAGDEV